MLAGPEGLVELITESDCDLVLNAIVGSAGLVPTVATLGEGIDLALANKESLVVGGELVTQLAEATGAAIIPVDSEHSALHQLLAGERPGTVDRLILTASGGPFRGRTPDQLADVTVEQALAHPTWAMGGKITIDSATLMNKGLELIEAHHLFGTPYEQIDVVVHPQSIVHSLIQLCDGATLAHLGYPDMRVPISYALHYPERVDVPVQPLDLAASGRSTFEPVDDETFACLALAREAGAPAAPRRARSTPPTRSRCTRSWPAGSRSCDIAAVIEETLERLPATPVHSFDSLAEADARARTRRRRAGGSSHERLSEPLKPACHTERLDVLRLAFLGFSALIILHEAGHFVAAKAVGMRVERFSLFFGPMLVKSPRRDRVRDRPDPARRLREDHRDEPERGAPARGRAARLLQPAGVEAGRRDRRRSGGQPPDRVHHPGGDLQRPGSGRHEPRPAGRVAHDRGRNVAGTGVGVPEGRRPDRLGRRPPRRRSPRSRSRSRATAARAPRPTAAAADAGQPDRRSRGAHADVLDLSPLRPGRQARARRVRVRRRRQAARGARRGRPEPLADVVRDRTTVSTIARLFEPKERSQLHGVVGGYTVTQEPFAYSATDAFYTLALISLSLAVVNLFPFLPLDGGHVFWAVAEKVRGRRIPFEMMERAGVVGFVLIIFLFVIGLSNDISTLTGQGFNAR